MPIPLRGDFDAPPLRAIARGAKDAAEITRRWARRGSRPSAPHDQRIASIYILGAICPKDGNGAAVVLPRCNIAGMNLHLAEIAMAVAPGAYAVLVLDQAGRHLFDQLNCRR